MHEWLGKTKVKNGCHLLLLCFPKLVQNSCIEIIVMNSCNQATKQFCD